MSRFSPPPSFGLVHPQLYRSATFHTPHFDFLSSLRLATLVSLGEDMPSRALQAWCEHEHVRFVHLGNRNPATLVLSTAPGRSWKPVSDELVKDALEFILNRAQQPCLIMDQSGIYETGIVVGCLRRLEGWTLSAILAEYASLAGSRSRGSNEQFIELFDTDLVAIPPKDRRVEWFAGEHGEEDPDSGLELVVPTPAEAAALNTAQVVVI